MLPTDFVARWLSFLGKFALYWARLEEPENERDRDFLLLSLGVTCLAVGVVASLTVIPAVADALNGILNVESTAEWFQKVAWVAQQAVVSILLCPVLVGILYRVSEGLRETRSRLLLSIYAWLFTLGLAVVVVLVAHNVLLMRGVAALGVIPLLIVICPRYPFNAGRRNSHRSVSSGSR